MNRLILLLFILILFPSLLRGQYHYPGSTTLFSNFTWLPPQELKDTSASFEFMQIRAGISVPLFKRIGKKDDRPRPSVWLINTIASGSLGLTCISHFNEQRQVIGAAIGGNTIYYNGNKNMYMVLLNASFSEDNRTISSPQIRVTGIGMMHRKVNEHFGYKLGAGYSFVFGKGLLLPVIGFDAKPGDRTTIHVTLPLNVTVKYRNSRHLHWKFFLSPAGSQSNFASDRVFGDTIAPVLKFRRKEMRLGTGAKYIKGNLTFTGMAGIAGGRKLVFTDGTKVIYRENIGATLFMEAGIAWKIKKKDKTNTYVDEKRGNPDPARVEMPEISEEDLLLEDIDLEDIISNE